MTENLANAASQALEYRRAFDQSFALEQVLQNQVYVNVLMMSIADNPFVVRLSEISCVSKCPKIVPVPSKSPALIGLAGIRSELLPVYSTAELLGCPREDEVRWLLIAGKQSPIALALANLDTCISVPVEAFVRSEQVRGKAKSQEVLTVGTGVRTVIQISELVKELSSQKEL